MNILKRFFQTSPQTLNSISAYDLWAQSYPAEAHNVLMQIEQASMLDVMPSFEDKIVLDLACGTGRYGAIADKEGAKQVIGLDNSPAMLNKGVISQVALATSENIPLPDKSIDVVLCGLALGHLPTIKASIHEIGRILKPEGVALVSDFHPYQYLTGARRIFEANKTHYAVEHYVHHLSDYFSLGQLANLQISALQEPIYQDNKPVVLVIRYEKNAD
ncbi:MAG: class I SAM-dependent methyltransferase [Phototrophicaceae bacterium]